MMRFVALDEELIAALGQDEERRYSHFEIALAADGSLLELGRGAMGTTYRALDTVLQSPVALKVVRENVSDLPAVSTRFLREARSAARLRHPNVASVFHYGEQHGECFYAMELVEGETLEAQVQRDGSLSAEKVLEIGLQVARALSAAEAQGLVHRDLKPSNIMLVGGHPDGKPGEPLLVKVIDFGLAKALKGGTDTASESETRYGFVGTPAYASPEQFAGGAQPVDTRSDIYSLGVTLWYLLCGRTPFRGNSLEEIRDRQFNQVLPVAQLVGKRVPTLLIALLRKTLAVDPDQRPQTTRELIEMLERCQDRVSPVRRRQRHRLWAIVLVLSVLSVVVASRRTERTGVTHARASSIERSVAVLPFENLSPDPLEAFLATATQSAVTEDLARVRDLNVIGADSTRAYAPVGRDLSAIGRELGVQFLLEGSVRQESRQTQIVARLMNARDGTLIWEKQYQEASADLFPAYRAITLDVASRLQAALSPDEQAAINRPPTNDPTAYDLYLRAVTTPDDISDDVGSLASMRKRASLLESAIGRDPRFALAQCELARVYVTLAFVQPSLLSEQRTVDYRQLAQAALQRASDLQPDAGEVHLLRADYFLRVEHDLERAGAESDLARRTLPNNAALEFIAGRVARRRGRWEDAVNALERAAALEPRNVDILQILAETYEALRRYPDYERTMRRVLANAPSREAASANDLENAVGPLESNADLGPLRRVRAERADDDSLSTYTRELTDLELALLGRDVDSLRRVLASTKKERFLLSGISYPKAFFEGVAARMSGDAAGARAAFARARPGMEQVVLAEPEDGRFLSVLALVDAGAGLDEIALREGRHARELVMPYEKFALEAPSVRSNLAAVYAWTGQSDLALAELNAIVDGPAGFTFFVGQPTYGDLCLNPCWDPLRGDPRFAALVARLAPKTPINTNL